MLLGKLLFCEWLNIEQVNEAIWPDLTRASPIRHKNILWPLQELWLDQLLFKRPNLFRPFRQRPVKVDVSDFADLVPVEVRSVRTNGGRPVVAVRGHVTVRKKDFSEVGQLLPELSGLFGFPDADKLGAFALAWPFLLLKKLVQNMYPKTLVSLVVSVSVVACYSDYLSSNPAADYSFSVKFNSKQLK